MEQSETHNFAGENLHPGRLTWNIIIEVWKIIFLSKWVIYMFHVNLPGCKTEKKNRAASSLVFSICRKIDETFCGTRFHINTLKEINISP